MVRPARIIESYGADTARWFMLSDWPPERDMEWTEAGVEGAWRYLNRVCGASSTGWTECALPPRRHADAATASRRRPEQDCAAPPTRRSPAVTDDIERFRFNRAVAQHLHDFANALDELPDGELGDGRGLGAARGAGDAGPADRADDAASGGGDRGSCWAMAI